MYTIVNIILLCCLSSQFNLNCLETLTKPARSTRCSIGYPILPAKCLYVCLVTDTTVYISSKANLDCLQTLCLSTCSTHRAISAPVILPAKRLHMRFVIDATRIRGYKRLRRCNARICTLWYDHDIDCLQTFCQTFGSCHLSILGPI